MSLWQTAVHESAHAVAAVLLHATRDAGPITIEPGKCYKGICYTGRSRRQPNAHLVDLTVPYPLLTATLRHCHEVRVMVLLAGAIAADLHAVHGAPELPEPAGESTGEYAPVDLPPREVPILDVAAARDESHSDVRRATDALLTQC